MAPQGRQDVSGGLFHPFGPAGQWAGQPFEHVYLMEEVLNLLLGNLLPYKLDDRNICLRVQPQKAMPMALADQPFCFLLPQLGGMHKHPLKDDVVVQSSILPQWVLV